MVTNHAIAIIPRTPLLTLNEAAGGAAAIQQFINSFFAHEWGVTATVSAFQSYAPIGFTPVFVDGIINAPPGYTGYHTTNQGHAYAIVQFGPTWTLTASHECMELLVDPDGMQTIVAPGPNSVPARFLLEICDPCQNANFAYRIGRYLLSDFCTRAYFGAPRTGVRYNFSGTINAPFEILPGGVLSWLDRRNWFYQRTNVNGLLNTAALGPYRVGPLPRRAYLNQYNEPYSRLSHGSDNLDLLDELGTAQSLMEDANKDHYAHFEDNIESLYRSSIEGQAEHQSSSMPDREGDPNEKQV